MNLGDANAINGGVHIDSSSHDTHYHERSRNELETRLDIESQLRTKAEELLNNDARIDSTELAELRKLAMHLGVSDERFREIVKQVRTHSATTPAELSGLNLRYFEQAKAAIRENKRDELATLLPRMESMVKMSDREEVHCYYYLALAALNPQKCITLFENQIGDDYWLTVWAIVAYCNCILFDKASRQLVIFNPAIYGKTEDDHIILEAYYNFGAGNVTDAKGFFDELMGEQSELLTPFCLTLEQKLYNDNTQQVANKFCLENFFVFKIKPTSKSELVEIINQTIQRNGNYCDLNFIDTSAITDMSYLFKDSPFNGDISQWDVSKVTNMGHIFQNSKFKGNISNWDMSSVTNIDGMLDGCDLPGRYVPRIYKPKSKEELISMIKAEIKKNGNRCSLNFIDTSEIIDMTSLFADENYCEYGLGEFNGNISGWDVSNVKNMGCMFAGSRFKGNISNWDVSKVEKMRDMFSRSEFDGDISKWDVRNVTSMSGMFDSSQFDGDISNWNVSNVGRTSKNVCIYA